MAWPALAGVSYQFRSVSAGITSTSLAGTVRFERGITRADIREGDPLTFRSGSFVVSRDAGRTLAIADPRNRTYYELRLEDLAGEGSALGALGALADLRVDNERVASHDLGAGPRLAGYPTSRTRVDVEYDVVLLETRAHVSSTTESWTTTSLPAEATTIFQSRASRTGIAAIDRLIDLHSRTARGFPLKQVSIVRVSFGGQQWVSKTTTTVHDVRVRAIPPEELAIPRGYRKVEGPFKKKK